MHLTESHGYSHADIQPLIGQTAVVTGASSGLGLGVARALALHGATLTVTARSQAKCDDTLSNIREHVKKNEEVEVAALLKCVPTIAIAQSPTPTLCPFVRSCFNTAYSPLSLSFLLPPHPSRTSSDNCLPSTRKASRKKLCSQSCVQPVANCRARCSFLDRSLHSRMPLDRMVAGR
jgi:hypothetical protein